MKRNKRIPWRLEARRLLRRRCLPRSGTTLVEMLIVMSVAAAMVGIAVCVIHLLLDAEHEATRAVRFNTSVSRLAQTFRGDMHAARQVDLPEPEAGKPVVLLAAIDGGQVRYELDGHLATRIETEGAKPVHREVYYFPPHSQMRFKYRANQDGPDRKAPEQRIVVLEIDMAAAASGAREVSSAVRNGRIRRLAIEAAPGRDHRFEVGQ